MTFTTNKSSDTTTRTVAGSSIILLPFDAGTGLTLTSDRFEKFREQWLRQVALDPELPAGALRLCIVMSTYINRRLGEAWPGMTRLAKETGLSLRYMRDLTRLVEERGHWRVTRIKVGAKNEVNHYQPVCTTVHQGSEVASSLGGSEVASSPEPLSIEPLSEPLRNRCGYTAPKGETQAKRMAEKERTLTLSDNPSLPSEPEDSEERRQRMRQTLEVLRSELRSGLKVVPPGRRVSRT